MCLKPLLGHSSSEWFELIFEITDQDGCWRNCSFSWMGFLCDASWLTPPARQAVALPAGRLAGVGVNTVASLQAARSKRAHLHMWTDAKEESSRQSKTLRRTQREQHLLPSGVAATRLLCKFPCCGTTKARLYTPSGPQTEWMIRPRRQGDKDIYHSHLQGSVDMLD